ncbi:uncharacterized protein ACR2FA_002630 [Aphomia sociella]
MKAFAIFVFCISTAAALGSGPYLPSGWRPKGPAFYLPSETQQKQEENPLKDVVFQESEASSSDFLREYGPPKVEEIVRDITKQNLPDVVTEQAFVVIEAKFNEDVKESTDTVTESGVENVSVDTEAKAEERVNTSENVVAVTESQVITEIKTTESALDATETLPIVEEKTTKIIEAQPVIQGKLINIEVEAEVETEDAVQTAIDATERNTAVQVGEIDDSKLINAVEIRIQKEAEQEVNAIVDGVKNIEEAILNIKTEEVLQRQAKEQNVQGEVDVKNTEESSRSLDQAPEGLLEYGPPGFREYGPPKEDIVPLAEIVAIH